MTLDGLLKILDTVSSEFDSNSTGDETMTLDGLSADTGRVLSERFEASQSTSEGP